MSNIDIIRAWKDEEYRNSLSEEERAQLPENPAGMIELSDDAAQAVAGGGLDFGYSYWTGTCGRVCAILTPQYNCKGG
jgi:mersacidin/lichenicidin family type 2 lantibiotic